MIKVKIKEIAEKKRNNDGLPIAKNIRYSTIVSGKVVSKRFENDWI
jgi:hypothetical protein